MVAAASGLIVVDIDTKNVGRDQAWKAWCDVCTAWGVEVMQPHCETPSGGWHVYTRFPVGTDVATLRQPALMRGVIDVRTNGFVLIPPSQIDGKQYANFTSS